MNLDVTKRGATIVELSRETTDFLLGINTHNRLPVINNVDRLGREMTSGEWELVSNGIGVCSEGFITNGGNRLLAHKNAGYPPGVEVVLVTGLSHRSQQKEDVHAKRDMAAILKLMLNRTVSAQVVAAVRVALRMKEGPDGFYFSGNVGALTISENDIAEFIDEHSHLIENLSAAVGQNGIAARAGTFAALIDFARKGFISSACDLAEKLRTGANIDTDHPAYRLRAWKNPSGGGAHHQRHAYAVTVSACIAFAQNRPMKLLKESRSWRDLPSLSAWSKRNLMDC